MSSGDSGINYGVTVLYGAPMGKVATVVATGMGRSGTTMVARVMAAAGVQMTSDLSATTLEDKTLQSLVKGGDEQGFRRTCEAYNAQWQRWAFKLPAMRKNLRLCAAELRQPRFIVMFRDIVAVTMRNNLAVNTEIAKGLRKAAKGYVALIQEIESVKRPTLLISYEKALQFPQVTVEAIAEFCGAEVNEETARRIAAENIINNDVRYSKQ